MTNALTSRRYVSVLLALCLAMAALVATAGTAEARKGAVISGPKWSRAAIDVTTKGRAVTFRVNIKDPNLTRSAYAVAETRKGAYRHLYLSLVSGSNRAGRWEAEGWFSAADRGAWRITAISTTDFDGYTYVKRSKGSLAKALKVKAGKASRLSISAPKARVAGDKFAATLKLRRAGHPIKKARVKISIYNAATNKSKNLVRRTNKRGVVTLRLTMPPGSTSISASYAGRARVTQPSSAWRQVERTFYGTRLGWVVKPTSVAPDDGTAKTVSVKLTDAKGRPLAGRAIVFNWWTYDYEDFDEYVTVRTGKDGVARSSRQVPLGETRVAASFGGDRSYTSGYLGSEVFYRPW